MNKIIIGILLISFAISSNAQETLIVRGYLDRPYTDVSINFKKKLFCYMQGDFIMPDFNRFCSFKVDSVISGSFVNFNNEINKPPFTVNLGVINECTVLDYMRTYTLKIKQFPNTNFYFIDSLNQVSPNEEYLDKLTEYHKTHQQNINILTKGTLQERHDLLDSILNTKLPSYNGYRADYKDYRYIRYILPYMTSQDSIINYRYMAYDGIDENGNLCCGGTFKYEENGLYSEYLYDYLNSLLPFDLPNKTTDSIGWHKWYESFFSEEKCFSTMVDYAKSKHKTIASDISIFQFIPLNRKIHIGTDYKSFIWNIDNDSLIEKCKLENCYTQSINDNYSIQKDEIAFLFFNSILYSPLNSDCILCQRILFDKFEANPRLVAHCGNDFLMFYYNQYDCRDCLKAGKMNRKGEWIIEPRNIYKSSLRTWLISGLSFCKSDKNETILSFVDIARSDTSTIIVYKINDNLEVKNSVMMSDYQRFTDTYILKKDKTYLLVAESYEDRDNIQLYYRLLNNDLSPKTDFVKLANHQTLTGKPILTSEGFMISWVDNDMEEGVLRSVLINKSGKQSNIINITNQSIDKIYNVEFDRNNVDIFLINQKDKSLIRKRINRKEYGL